MIAFPPCTHIACSGARYFEAKRADGRQQEGIDFFLALANAPIPRIAIENPVGIMSSVYRKPDQIIQPWQFGHSESKATCLWLNGLPPLVPTDILLPPAFQASGKPRWENQTPSGQSNLGPTKDRWKIRSKTYQGIAAAMADQWGSLWNAVILFSSSLRKGLYGCLPTFQKTYMAESVSKSRNRTKGKIAFKFFGPVSAPRSKNLLMCDMRPNQSRESILSLW